MEERAAVRWDGVLLCLVVGFAGLSAWLLAGQILAPRPVHGAGLVIDRLSASLALLVSTVGAVVFRFAMRYLDGEPGRRAFLTRLACTTGAAYILMLADHLLVLFAAWLLTSLGLHALLTHYADRPEALPPARKKFLISRLGDAALVAAIVVIGATWGTLEISTFLKAAGAPDGDGRGALGVVAVLVAIAALTKSAQFPFHSWLPETMEAPTPVSAFMHAGIINAGGALLLKFAPVIARAPEALLMLTLVGTATAALGLMAMWSQVKVKRTLAWSTVGQMGFMMTQCGLGAFPAAWLHMLGHGLYKAWSFLRSGELPGPGRPRASYSPARTLALAAFGTALALPALALAARATGYAPVEAPGELALAAMVALSIGQLWVALLNVPMSGRIAVARGVAAVLGTFAVAFGAFALYRESAVFLAPVLGDIPHPQGPLAWAAAAVPVAAMVVLTVLQALLPVLVRRPSGRAFYVHALNGFYFGAIADRLVARVWGGFGRFGKGVQGA